MKKNKFIPLAVLAGLVVVGFAMNNQQCTAEQSQPACTTKKCQKEEAKNNKNRKNKDKSRTRKSENKKQY